MNKLFYPAVFELEESGGFTVTFPDVKECMTCGDNMEQAYEMAVEALGLVLSYMEDEGESFPKASLPQDITVKQGQFVVVVEFDMLAYRKKINGRAVKKTLSIPAWLNEEALSRNINFSQVLQEALMMKLGL